MNGSFTVNYSNSQDSEQPLHLTVDYSGESMVPAATASPKYQILSVLYTAPGNASSSGFSNSESAGATTSIANNFNEGTSISYSGGFVGASNGVSFSFGTSQGNTTSYTTSYQATSSSQLASSQQKMDHTQDQIYLLVDPQFTVVQTGDAAGYFDIGPSVDATGTFTNGEPADILNVNIAGLETPSLIPVDELKPQVPIPGTTLPGLSFVCANPLPPDECTTQNACGCTSTDFAAIVPYDELAGDTNDSTQPSSIDSARYVFVTDEPLEGPQQSGGGAVKNTFQVSDADIAGYSTSNGTSYGVGFTHKWSIKASVGSFTLASATITSSTSFKYSHTQTVGNTNGISHVATVTLGTSNVGCFEYVDVYEDTTYHTFAYALSQPAPADC